MACQLKSCTNLAILAARAMMEKEPAYSQVTVRLLLHTRKEVFIVKLRNKMRSRIRRVFPEIHQSKGIEAGLLDSRLGQ